MQNTLGAVCSQLLTTEDLMLEEELAVRVTEEKIVTRITINDTTVSVRFYADHLLMLSDITPILHDFGFAVIDEVTYGVPFESHTIHVCRFNLGMPEAIDRFDKARENIESVMTASLRGETFANCRLYALVHLQNFSLRQITLMRAMIEYVHQAVDAVSFDAFVHTLTRYDDIARLLLHAFYLRFDPEIKAREGKFDEVDAVLREAIKSVPDILDDRIVKLLYALVRSTVRTNYFLQREEITFKIDVSQFSEHLRGIQPRREIFVYHPEFRGVHLRMSKISRGGIRWSERHDDYRNEIRSLMITQEGKNAIIIPDGAKGGFVIERPREAITKEDFTRIYRRFMHNLLDMIDNVEGGRVVRDERLVIYDDDDTYFVVAADKGTAAMSDTANAVAAERGYWLGDAFASGGSNGYDHKALGITARGAMRSTQRFFIERGIDPYRDDITVVGIGSMNGDVFGNGMLLSKNFKLLGAISHKEVFVDPDPIPLAAFEERQRLFRAKDGSWSAYNKSLVSKGGGVWPRSEKAIALSDEIRVMLGTEQATMSGEELARALLCMKVDLLFNGGVGTYVKHSEESDLEIGDKQNESVRVNAGDLRCFAVCEGGNLGFTQRARIEYAQNGGRINLDGIDNAAGVNTSDHEVNLKILLGRLESKGMIDEHERVEILQRMSGSVSEAVLESNYRQALAISRDERLSRIYLDDFLAAVDIIAARNAVFNRRNFFIPKNENIVEVQTRDGALVRPILGSLLSYAKIFIKQFVIDTPLVDEPFAQRFLHDYFPRAFVGSYEDEISRHPLRREIIATVIADRIVNNHGVSFLHDFDLLGEARFLMKIRSYLVCNALFGADDIRQKIFAQDYKMSVAQQYKLLSEMEQILNFSTQWMVKYIDAKSLDAMHIVDHRDDLFAMLSRIRPKRKKVLIEGDDDFNRFFDALDYLRFAVAVIVTKEQSKRPFEDVATLFYLVVERFAIVRIINMLNALDLHEEGDLRLRRQLLQFIEYIAVHYTNRILDFQRVGEPPVEAFESFLANDKDVFREVFEAIHWLDATKKPKLRDIAVTVNLLMASVI